MRFAPSVVRSEKLQNTDSSDGGDVGLHAYLFVLDAMAWGARSAPGRFAPNTSSSLMFTPTPPHAVGGGGILEKAKSILWPRRPNGFADFGTDREENL